MNNEHVTWAECHWRNNWTSWPVIWRKR